MNTKPLDTHSTPASAMHDGLANDRDDDAPDAALELPDLPVSEHPNYVTEQGLAQLRERLRASEAQLASMESAGAGVDDQRALVIRELRWLQARTASAILLPAERRVQDRVAFAAQVELVDQDERTHRYRIVGEDEADPDQGSVSWVSPLARALEGAQVGDSVVWPRPAGDLEVEVVSIEYPEG